MARLRGARALLNQAGQGLVEYALIILFVAIAIAGALGLLGTELANTYADVASQIP